MTHPAAALARVIACVIFAGLAADALAAPGLSVKVRQGLGGRWWTGPCAVTLEASVEQGHVEGELAWVSEAHRGPARQVMKVSVDGPARQLFRLLEPIGASPLGTGSVELDGVPLQAVNVTSANGLLATRFLVVVLGEAPAYAAAETVDPAPDGPDVQVSVANALVHEMPESTFGFGPMRLLVLRGREVAKLDAKQVAAILDWVHLGGRLLISPGVPPAPLRDVPWLEPLLPGTVGAARIASAQEVARQLHVMPAGQRALDAVALAPREGATSITDGEGTPLSCRRQLGAGQIELLGLDETQLGEHALRAFLTARLSPMEHINRPLFGHTWEVDALRVLQAMWAARHDGIVAAALVAWALVLWFLSRTPATGSARSRSPLRRVLFRPAVAAVMAIAILTRRAAPEPPRIDVFAALKVEAGSDTASGDAVLAAAGTAGTETVVPLVPGRVRHLAGLERRGSWRAFYTPPFAYRVRAAPSPAIEALRAGDTVPHLFDLAVVVPMGGVWNAKLTATDRQVVDGWLTNGSAHALEAGYLVVEGFASLLPRIEAGATCRGPFRLEHITLVKAPPAPEHEVDALPELLREVQRGFSFPSDGLLQVGQFGALVVGRMGVPAAAYSPRGTAAVSLATIWLPSQTRAAQGW